MFPDLNTGNTTYKAVQRSAHVVSIGPMLQGLRKPVNDLSRGALVDDIVYHDRVDRHPGHPNRRPAGPRSRLTLPPLPLRERAGVRGRDKIGRSERTLACQPPAPGFIDRPGAARRRHHGDFGMFITEDFLLDTGWSRKLYHEVAAELPIIDYHAHLPPADLAGRKKFRNIAELWLGSGNYGDHYKWRLMRAAGVPEHLITGDAPDRERFDAFCRILPLCAGSPVLHWAHFELKRIFGIDAVIDAETAPRIWEQANERLAGMDTWSLLTHAKWRSPAPPTIRPTTWRRTPRSPNRTSRPRCCPPTGPTRPCASRLPPSSATLSSSAARRTWTSPPSPPWCARWRRAIDYFHARGGRASDHAIDIALPDRLPEAGAVEAAVRAPPQGRDADPGGPRSPTTRPLLLHLGRAYARKGWVMGLHIGALRNVNSRALAGIGTDAGYDTIGEMTIALPLARLLDALDRDDRLPKTMLFCMSPVMNPVLTAMTGCFQDGKIPGKLQFGPAWWFNDTQDGNLDQMRIAGQPRGARHLRLTHNFRESLNRARVTCTGTLEHVPRTKEDAADLREPLRCSPFDSALIAAIR